MALTRNLQVVAEAATGAVQRWIRLNDEATARIMKREEHIEWLRKLFTGWKEARPALRESQRRDNAGNAGTGQQPVGRTRAATAAQAGGSGDGGQRAKWVRLMMLLRLRERFRCWAGFRLVLTAHAKRNRRDVQGIQEGEKEEERRRVRTKQRLAQTRAGQTRGLGRCGAGADGIGRRGNVGKRHEEGGDFDRLWRTRRQTTQGRRR